MPDTLPTGAEVYVDGQYLGTTPVPLVRVPTGSLLALSAPGRRLFHRYREPGDSLELVELLPLPDPDPAALAADQAALLAGLRWVATPDGWRVDGGQLYHRAEISPGGRHLATVLAGPPHDAGWSLFGFPQLLWLDPARLDSGAARLLRTNVSRPAFWAYSSANSISPDGERLLWGGWAPGEPLTLIEAAHGPRPAAAPGRGRGGAGRLVARRPSA